MLHVRSMGNAGIRGAATLGLEALESRLNLSTLTTLPLPTLTTALPAARIVGTPSVAAVRNLADFQLGAPAGDPTAAFQVSAQSWMMPWTYSASSGTQTRETAWGTAAFLSGPGSYAEYTLNVATAGTYTLATGLATTSGGVVAVSVNGAPQAAYAVGTIGADDDFVVHSTSITLGAGLQTLRFAIQSGSAFNINSIELARQITAPSNSTNDGTPTSVPTPSGAAMSTIRDQNWLSPTGFSGASGGTILKTAWGTAAAISGTGSYVEYTLNVQAAGVYTLNTGVATTSGGTVAISVGGVAAGSFNVTTIGAADDFVVYSQKVTLAAGVQTLRFSIANGSMFNVNSLALLRQSAAPTPTPTPTPTPAPVPILPATPAPATITQRNMTSFTELDIVGTSGDDTILLSQNGTTYTINSGGTTQTVTGNFGDIVIHGGDGNDTITLAASVTGQVRAYGDGGNDTLINVGQGRATLVALGGGVDTLTGNGINTSYWADTKDVVNASAAESAAGRVHVIAAFYQPVTSTPGAAGYVTADADGVNLADPAADAGASSARLTSSSFWGTGPVQEDIHQGNVSDCYFLTVLQDMARLRPDALREMAVDLGDGTFAVEFQRGGVTSYVRVDGDLPTQWGTLEYNRLGASGDEWGSIMEKAYAEFRTGANSYASLNYGWMTDVYADVGIASGNFAMLDQTGFYNMVSAKLAAGKAVDVGTLGSITYGTPLIANHTYSVVGVAWDKNAQVQVTLRNPWGSDGFNVDSNPYDGLLTMTFTTLKVNTLSGEAVS